MESIGERIRKARQAKELTQAQLGAKCGMADSAIRRYESGRGNPTLETIQRIANALDVLPGELLGTVPQPDREYEKLCDTLHNVGLSIEEVGFGEGPDEYGDHFYIWHTDAGDPEEDRVEITYGDLLKLVSAAQKSAELQKTEYLRKRLELDLFWPEGFRLKQQ